MTHYFENFDIIEQACGEPDSYLPYLHTNCVDPIWSKDYTSTHLKAQAQKHLFDVHAAIEDCFYSADIESILSFLLYEQEIFWNTLEVGNYSDTKSFATESLEEQLWTKDIIKGPAHKNMSNINGEIILHKGQAREATLEKERFKEKKQQFLFMVFYLLPGFNKKSLFYVPYKNYHILASPHISIGNFKFILSLLKENNTLSPLLNDCHFLYDFLAQHIEGSFIDYSKNNDGEKEQSKNIIREEKMHCLLTHGASFRKNLDTSYKRPPIALLSFLKKEARELEARWLKDKLIENASSAMDTSNKSFCDYAVKKI